MKKRNEEIFEKNYLIMEKEEQNKLILSIRFGEDKEVEDNIRQTIGKMRRIKGNKIQYQAYMISVLEVLVQVSWQANLNYSGIAYSRMIEHADEIEKIEQWLLEACKKMNSIIHEEKEFKNSITVVESIKYIQEHYMDQFLTVKKVALQMELTYNYFSSLFTKEMGINCIAYITQMRLEKAAELVKLTEYTTREIAKKVGYKDVSYFSNVFKKQYGISPTKYRREFS